MNIAKWNFVVWINCKLNKEKSRIIFSNVDTDNNRYIEIEEFISAYINPKLFYTQNYLKFVFDYFDNDKSGTISFKDI